jgi:murein L,D-transpeptidase YcbB/YkuD
MKKLLFIPLVLSLLSVPGSTAGAIEEPCADLPWSRIAGGNHPLLSVSDFSDQAEPLLRLYLASGGSPVWFHGGVPSPQARLLAGQLASAQEKGLDPDDYDGRLWPQRLTFVPPVMPDGGDCRLPELDLAFSVAVMRYVTDLSVGRVDPGDLGLHLDVTAKRRDPARLLQRLALADEPEKILYELEPPFRRYRALLQALRHYRELARDSLLSTTLEVPSKLVRPGDAYPDSHFLAYKLWRLGDLPVSAEGEPGVYDADLVEAVRRFQGRHGLEQDGILGGDTFGQLNAAPEDRVRQILLTLERWRWLPHDLGHRPIVINVPEYRLYAFEADSEGGYREALTMAVIVGQAYPRFQTPVFRADMSYIVFSPYWNVPWSITRRELMPEIKADPEYLTKNHFEIVASYHPDEPALPETPENLALLPSGHLFLRQTPGKHNALGVAKFMFPNNHNVYLHGTPAMGLFIKDARAFSHGCIRLEDPRGLAEHVLSQEDGWGRERIDELIGSGRRTVTGLGKRLSVYVLYGTALADEDGTMRFMRDIYGHDGRMAKLLRDRRGDWGWAD